MKSFKQFCREGMIKPMVFEFTMTELMDEISDLRDCFDCVTATVYEEPPFTVVLRFEK